MLGHLIKYDLKFIYKQLVIFYIITLTCAIISRLTNVETDSFILIFIQRFTQGSAFGFGFGTFINATMRTWARFRQNLYGDESYLTHTLPVTRHTLWASKFLTSLIVTVISIVVLLSAFLIMFFSQDFITGWLLDDPNMVRFYLLFILAAFLQVIYIFQAGFAGIIIGHRYNNHRPLHSVLWGLITYFIGQTIIILLVTLWGTLDPAVHDMIFSGAIHDANDMNKLLLGFTIGYVFIITISYFINDKLLSRGVDVD